ncbi:MAG: tRNA (N(6)-L-threonylcarbamoyladenosine(37)-C(2))-methylthiotransferase MtaB [Geobacter sp.]|nr:tRNA (N(6)-L-threonylcarbamoyladenosine(37)-C(2))-methylthiotransferase MtaB [Geobacter sp.]
MKLSAEAGLSKRVAITTLGCKTNQFESAGMSESLEQQGYRAVPFSDEADVYIINTCSVTAKSDAESRKLIRRAARLNPAARVVVTGCYAQLAADELSKLPNVSLVIGNSEKRDIARLLANAAPGEGASVVVTDIGAESTAGVLHLESFAEHTRAFLQIQNGCNAFCAYCIVPYARGRSRSVAFDEVLAGVARFAAAGFREVVLTGIHLGAYGKDLAGETDLTALLSAIDASGAVNRLRIGSVEPDEVSPQMIGVIASGRHICPHMHLPLQSGSDRVLAAMGRGYTSGEIRALVASLVKALPGIAIGFDVIAGFPGESAADHAATCALLEELPVAYLHVFPYSSRPGTRAATMPGHLDPAVIKERAAELRQIGERKKRNYAAGFVGRELSLLMQGGNNGITPNYLAVKLAEEAAGEVPVRITGVNRDGSCRGELVK